MTAAPVWYLLYSGSSVDGRGHGVYTSRTIDAVAAARHALACLQNPYATGYVLAVNDVCAVRLTEMGARALLSAYRLRG
jgi:hypothetical protein